MHQMNLAKGGSLNTVNAIVVDGKQYFEQSPLRLKMNLCATKF